MRYCITKDRVCEFATESGYCHITACIKETTIDDNIKQLPSIQPDIVRCKDCKHWIPYDWMFSEVWQSNNIADYHEDDIGCNLCDMAMKADDYCSRAVRREVTE